MGGTATGHVDPANLEQSRAWDGDEGDYWADHAAQFDAAVAGYHRALMKAADIGAADRVLDVGCGTGQTTRDAARMATAGHAHGVDLSTRMLAVARALARTEGVANVDFECTDAQVQPFQPGSFDIAISRTGVMFFADPVAAFANIRRALHPAGRLVLAVWQPVAENEWFQVLTGCLAAGRVLPTPPPEAPNPFALSDPRRVDRILGSAGFGPPSYTSVREPMFFGADPEEALDFVSKMLAWMLDGLDEAGRERALSDLHRAMAEHHGPGGVAFGSAMWLIAAEAHPTCQAGDRL